jgi:hypothetical protein
MKDNLKNALILLAGLVSVIAFAASMAAMYKAAYRAPTNAQFAAACTAAGGVAMQTLDGPDCLKIETIPIMVMKP